MSEISGKKVITMYMKPTCSTCRAARSVLLTNKIELRTVDYYTTPFTKELLQSIIKKLGVSAREIMRTKEPIYDELGLYGESITEEKLIETMLEHPDLIKRPILVSESRAIIARPLDLIAPWLAKEL